MAGVGKVNLREIRLEPKKKHQKKKPTQKPIGTALCEAIQHSHKDVHIFRLKNPTSKNFPQIKNNLIEIVKELYAYIVKIFYIIKNTGNNLHVQEEGND